MNNLLAFPGSLHNHTDYSNLRLRDSINRIDSLIDYAIELGHEVIAFTEHETVSNAIKIENYYNKIKKEHPDFKVILGNEIYLCRDGLSQDDYIKGTDKFYHFILLAKDAEGHRQIREISTRAWRRSWMDGRMRRVPTYYQDIIDIIGSNPGHVIGSTACLGGFIDNKILEYHTLQDKELYQKIQNWCLQMQEIFGKGNFYLEMQPSNNKEQIIANKGLYILSKELDIPFIISTDSHYERKEDAPIHKAYLNSQDGDREVDAFYATTYLMDTEELESYMGNFSIDVFQEAYQNILNIKNACEDYSLKKELKIPSLKWKTPKTLTISQDWINKIPYLKNFIESDFDGDKILARAIIDKLESDARLQNQETYDELNSNLKTTWISSEVNKAHWSAYFLNLQQILDVCWDAGTLVGPGRGSGVGFLLLYILEITQINPLWETTKCYEWRFLNPERVSVLDVDVDVEGSRRAQVLSALRSFYGEDRVSNVATFGTEKSKSAIQTAARGLGIDNDIALYISSLIPADRGQTRTLKECYYGDKEKDFKPIASFVREMNNYPELWRVAQKIEGLICRIGEHAGGVIFVDEDFSNSTALMRAPNGDLITQFDLHDSEAVSLIKYDLLSVEGLDKIHTCIDLICDNGFAERKPTLKETYEDIIGIYNLERTNPKMWEMVWNHKIESLFQMEQQSGVQGIALIKPKSVDELAVLNSVIRLMAPDKDSKTPLEMWATYRKNIAVWVSEMRQAGLTEEEIRWLQNHSAITDGICESQEGLMSLVQEPRLGGHDLNFADRCRKALAKKIGSLFDECEKEFYDTIKEKGLSERLAVYVWDRLLRVQRGYSFNRSHCLAYSLVGLQEMNLAFRFPIIFWNTACLITDSGGSEDSDSEGKNNDYDKIAKAINKMQSSGVEVSLPDINQSQYTFTPDVENNKIYFGLRGMLNVGEEIVQEIIAKRPYYSPKDFMNKVNPKRQVMISLIKGGAFDNMIDRKLCMAWYIWENCDKKKRITLQNMGGLIKYKLLPEEKEEYLLARRVYEFNRYIKAITKADKASYANMYSLDTRAINFLNEINCDDLMETDNLAWFIKIKTWDNVYQKYMDIFRNWIAENKEEILQKLNEAIFLEDWIKYASGNYSSWEMEALCFYYHDHELKNINVGRYGIFDFFKMPEDPVIERSFPAKNGGEVKIFKLYKICGTCIAKDKNKGLVTLLTPTGVVKVKMRKEHFALYDKQISAIQEDGTKKVVEKSWFNRGSMIIVQGYRSGDNFIPKKYSSQGGPHQLYKITAVLPNGELTLQDARHQGDLEDET